MLDGIIAEEGDAINRYIFFSYNFFARVFVVRDDYMIIVVIILLLTIGCYIL